MINQKHAKVHILHVDYWCQIWTLEGPSLNTSLDRAVSKWLPRKLCSKWVLGKLQKILFYDQTIGTWETFPIGKCVNLLDFFQTNLRWSSGSTPTLGMEWLEERFTNHLSRCGNHWNTLILPRSLKQCSYPTTTAKSFYHNEFSCIRWIEANRWNPFTK